MPMPREDEFSAGSGRGPVRWGILGPGTIAANFAEGLKAVPDAVLSAIASRDPARRDAFGARFGVDPARRFDSYDALCADDGIDVVYVATPHPFHLEHGLQVLRAGKALVVEKPAGVTADEVAQLVAAARDADVFFMEAFKCRCHPQMRRLAGLLRDGAVGRVRQITASYGFSVPFYPVSRLFDPALGGGGILDVGCYTIAAARLCAGAAQGRDFAEPLALSARAEFAETGVDSWSQAELDFGDGLHATVACAIARKLDNTLTVTGDQGRIVLNTPWTPGRNAGPSDAAITIEAEGAPRTEWFRDPRQLFALEAEVATRAILDDRRAAPWPAMTPADSLGNAAAIDLWRAAIRPE